MKKESGITTKVSSKVVKETGNSQLMNNNLPFSLMFHIAEGLLYFDILGLFSQNLKMILYFPATFLVNLPFLL